MSRRPILAALVLVAAISVGVTFISRAARRPAPRTRADGARLLESVMRQVQARYVDSVDADQLWRHAATGMVDELGDPASEVLEADRAKRLEEQARGAYGGIGLSADQRGEWQVVLSVREGSPADRAGIQVGDRLVEADGVSLRGANGAAMRAAMRGERGSGLRLVIERAGERIALALTRDEIHVRAVPRAMRLADNVGYAQLAIINDSSATELAATVDSLVRDGAKSLVLDLRGNPGGVLGQGVAVADLFLDAGAEIVSVRGRVLAKPEQFVDRTAQRWPALPVAVLVDGGTASAAEIIAGALQDHDRALIIGRISFGKGSAQSVYPLDSGVVLKLTTARWFTPRGRSIARVRADSAGVPVRDVADSLRPTFKTASGRTVRGGGGIVPDVIAGDSATVGERNLSRILARNLPRFREAVAEAAATGGRAAFPVIDAPVPAAMREALIAAVARRGLGLTRTDLDGAARAVERLLGNEAVRQRFGLPAVALRAVHADPVVREAATRLRAAASPKDVFAQRVTTRPSSSPSPVPPAGPR
ncbi:MAG: S41 family peptidase [Gemmatimonadaceae bacterium]|nr:S41 family peptidase [Gemmatimonadaceae bacterium]